MLIAHERIPTSDPPLSASFSTRPEQFSRYALRTYLSYRARQIGDCFKAGIQWGPNSSNDRLIMYAEKYEPVFCPTWKYDLAEIICPIERKLRLFIMLRLPDEHGEGKRI